jgi:hypothetical protein
MRNVCLLLFLCCLIAVSHAQTKSARDYYQEAKEAGALPSLPYVCFRTTTEALQRETSYVDPTFAMLGTSQQISEIIKNKSYERMSKSEREQLQQLRATDYLYVQGFDHGVKGPSNIFDRKDPNDPSRSDWVFEDSLEGKRAPLTWYFNINWGTLRFREQLTMNSDTLFFYGQCELVNK